MLDSYFVGEDARGVTFKAEVLLIFLQGDPEARSCAYGERCRRTPEPNDGMNTERARATIEV